jgi:DNA-binding NtrC family response regulator
MKNKALMTLRDALAGTGASHAPTLLIVGPVEDDGGRDSALDQFPWRTHRVRNCLEFLLHLCRSHPRVVVCERDLPDGDWRDVLEVTASLLSPPPVIVTSRLADDYLWAEVLNLGGYDVLAKPLDKQEVNRTLNLAWGHWASQKDSAQRPKTVPVCKGESTLCLTA